MSDEKNETIDVKSIEKGTEFSVKITEEGSIQCTFVGKGRDIIALILFMIMKYPKVGLLLRETMRLARGRWFKRMVKSANHAVLLAVAAFALSCAPMPVVEGEAYSVDECTYAYDRATGREGFTCACTSVSHPDTRFTLFLSDSLAPGTVLRPQVTISRSKRVAP